MSAFLFLQRFENGLPVAVPFAEAVSALGRYGKTGRGRGDLEITFDPDAIAIGCTIVGNPETGAVCIGFERPRFDAALRSAVWDCMRALDCTAFNDTLDSIYVPPTQARALPSTWGAPALGTARQITTAQQLWPDELETPVKAAPAPAARYDNPNTNGPNLQMFDRIESAPQGLTIEIGMRPEACNPGTLRILRNLELRVDAAIRTNPEYKPYYRFAHQETSIHFLESPRLIQDPTPATIITSPPGTAYYGTGFIADRGIFELVGKAAANCVELARQEYRVDLDGSLDSIDTLSTLLDAVHEVDRQERRAQPTETGPAGKTTMRWALLAGAYLGTIIQRLVGGQWGYMRRPGSRSQPAIRMHNGRIRHPHLQVLDHVINGHSDDVAAWVRALAAADRSATPRQEDLVCNVPGFCRILLGADAFADGNGLPLDRRS